MSNDDVFLNKIELFHLMLLNGMMLFNVDQFLLNLINFFFSFIISNKMSSLGQSQSPLAFLLFLLQNLQNED